MPGYGTASSGIQGLILGTVEDAAGPDRGAADIPLVGKCSDPSRPELYLSLTGIPRRQARGPSARGAGVKLREAADVGPGDAERTLPTAAA